jgi:DNA-binding response OmpR family regulator
VTQPRNNDRVDYDCECNYESDNHSDKEKSMSDKKRILLVDDDVDFVEATKVMLEAHGFDVSCAYDGKEGLATAKQVKPDLMILDVMMTSDSEGFEVAREIPATPELEGTPVIMLTGIRREKNLAYGFEPDESWLPVKDVLEKPIDPARLIAVVENALRKIGK